MEALALGISLTSRRAYDSPASASLETQPSTFRTSLSPNCTNPVMDPRWRLFTAPLVLAIVLAGAELAAGQVLNANSTLSKGSSFSMDKSTCANATKYPSENPDGFEYPIGNRGWKSAQEYQAVAEFPWGLKPTTYDVGDDYEVNTLYPDQEGPHKREANTEGVDVADINSTWRNAQDVGARNGSTTTVARTGTLVLKTSI